MKKFENYDVEDEKVLLRLDEASDEFAEIKKHWMTLAKEAKTAPAVFEFMRHLIYDYVHDYGTACHAIVAMAIAAASYGAHREGITGFQAYFVMWGFIREWWYKDNKSGLKILDYDRMLYPQYEYKFEKTIDREIFEKLQEQAKEKLENEDLNHVHPNVIAHWKSIVDGIVPFGYVLEKEFTDGDTD